MMIKVSPSVSRGSLSISCIIYMAYAIFYITGPNGELHNYIQIMLFGLWNIVALMRDPKSYEYAVTSKPSKYLALFLLYYFATSIIEADLRYVLTYVGAYLMLYTCQIQFLYYYKRNRLKEIRLIVWLSLIVWCVISLNAISFYKAFPAAARVLASDFTAYNNLFIGGGYAIAFGSAILFTYLMTLLFRRVLSRFLTIILILFECILFYLIIKTESTTTLIATIIGAFTGILYEMRNGKSKSVKVLFYSLCFAAVIFIFNGGINTIGSGVYSLTANSTDELYSRRFNRIAEKLMFVGSDNSGEENYVDERWGLVTESFNTFLDNPIFGVGYKVGNVFSKLEQVGVGTHSEICDILAQFGLVGGILFFVYFISSIKLVNRTVKNKSYLVTLLIMFLLNPFHYFHGFYALFLLMPFIDLLMTSKITDYGKEKRITNVY